MTEAKPLYFKKSFIKALMIHGAVLLLVVVSFRFTPTPVSSEAMDLTVQKDETPNIVQAVTVNQTQVEQALAKLKSDEAQKQLSQQKALNKLQSQAALAKAQQENAQKQVQQLQQQKNNLAAQQLAEAKKAQDTLDALKKQKAQETQEAAQQLADLKKQQKEAQDQLLKTQAEAKKKQDALKAQQQLLAQQKQQAAAAAQSAAKQQADAAHQQQVNAELNRYAALITQAIEAQWTLLPGAKNQKLTTTMLIELASDGRVLSVKNVDSSGNDVLDRLALSAVYKASPLPVPNDPELFQKLKELKVSFKDE